MQFCKWIYFNSISDSAFCNSFPTFTQTNYTKAQIVSSSQSMLNIEELEANRQTVSAHKYGFFLCKAGEARILLGSNIYSISCNHLCIYTPNTFFQILEKSNDLKGILKENDVDAYYPAIGSIDIRKRLQIRDLPCVKISKEQADEIVRLADMTEEKQAQPTENITTAIRNEFLRYIEYALCLKVLEVYFANTPIVAVPHDKRDTTLNRFLISVHENCQRHRSVQYYAGEQHLSPYYFSSIIKSRSGKSALQWIENVTMSFARQYLTCTDMSIKEIAGRMNFPDQSSFARYFKRHAGCTPAEFRKKKIQDKSTTNTKRER